MNLAFTRWLQSAAIYLLILAIVFFMVALSTVVLQALRFVEFEIVSRLSELFSLGEILKYLGIALGGVVLMLQALIANRRATAMEETAAAQAEAAGEQARANRNTEAGQRQERLKNAIEHLGNDAESVRLGGAYELLHLALDTESLRQTVLDILCSHIRRITRRDEYRALHTSQPSEEIQSLLTLLFVEEHDAFFGLRINLYSSWLNGAELRGARLCGADLRRSSLNGALLGDAHLERVKLSEAHLKESRLMGAHLREGSLFDVRMQGANLEGAHLQRADIQSGHLSAAYLHGACLRGADLSHAQMYGATLSSASLQGAQLSWTYLQGAFLDNANFEGVRSRGWKGEALLSFAARVRASADRLSDLSGVQDSGITRKRLEQILDELKSPEKRIVLEQRLRPYVGRPVRTGLPEGHRSNAGSYTEEDAEQWIEEHETAMRLVNGSTQSRSLNQGKTASVRSHPFRRILVRVWKAFSKDA